MSWVSKCFVLNCLGIIEARLWNVTQLKAHKYIKTEWSAMQTILQDGNLELSNNLAEQMMRHIKLNLKNCLNIGSEDSALDYAFMFSVIESCNMNKLSPGCYIKELVSRLTAKPVCTAEKVALLPCFMQK